MKSQIELKKLLSKIKLEKIETDKGIKEKVFEEIEGVQITLNDRFIKQAKSLPTFDIADFKKNKEIYNIFKTMRAEHIKYFDKFPLYLKKTIQDHLKKNTETLEFDANKLTKDINSLYTMSSNRAIFIATDQLGKHLSAINEAQNLYVGAKKYIWRTVGDGRVRTEHRERNGKIFYYSRPPKDGHAGFPPRCRCYQEAVLG